MEQERELTDYRDRLLNAAKTGARRSVCGTSDAIQVFVNQRRVGLLDGKGVEASLEVQTAVRIDNVQPRSEDGVLLGGLFAPEYGFRTSRIPLLRDTIELRVQNYAQGGSVSAVSIPARSFLHRARQVCDPGPLHDSGGRGRQKRKARSSVEPRSVGPPLYGYHM